MELTAASSYDIREARIVKIETLIAELAEDTREIKRDIRWLIGLMLSFGISILGFLTKISYLAS